MPKCMLFFIFSHLPRKAASQQWFLKTALLRKHSRELRPSLLSRCLLTIPYEPSVQAAGYCSAGTVLQLRLSISHIPGWEQTISLWADRRAPALVLAAWVQVSSFEWHIPLWCLYLIMWAYRPLPHPTPWKDPNHAQSTNVLFSLKVYNQHQHVPDAPNSSCKYIVKRNE